MFVHSEKRTKRLDACAVAMPPIASDLQRAKYVKRMVSAKHTITVIGSGDQLAIVTLQQLARTLIAGQWKHISGERAKAK